MQREPDRQLHAHCAGRPSQVPEADKAAVRENVLESMVRAPQAVRTQLGECLRALVHADFPQRWPGLLPILLHNLASQVAALLHMDSSVP